MCLWLGHHCGFGQIIMPFIEQATEVPHGFPLFLSYS